MDFGLGVGGKSKIENPKSKIPSRPSTSEIRNPKSEIPTPGGGWLDVSGSENGDKCVWIYSGQQGAVANISLNGTSFPVQSLWSNASNGCVI